jgi:hypothetical protein
MTLMLGAFDDPASLRPSDHYGIEGRLPWVDINADLPGEETDVDPRPSDCARGAFDAANSSFFATASCSRTNIEL